MQKLSLIQLSTLLVLSACGRFDFESRVALQANIPEAKFVTMDAGTSLGYGGCSPVTVTAWFAKDVPGGLPPLTKFKLAGLRAGDKVFSDSQCKVVANAAALATATAAVQVTYFVQTGSTGSIRLEFSSDRFAAVSQTVNSVIAASKLVYLLSNKQMIVGAGFCQGPISVQVQDANSSPYAVTSQSVKIAGGEGMVFSDALCTNGLNNTTLNIQNSSSGVFYIRRNSVKQSVTMTLTDTRQGYLSSDSLSLNFASVPYELRLTGGPVSKQVVLGVCDTNSFKLELRDVEGNVTSPLAGTTLRVETSSIGSVNFRPQCGAMGGVTSFLSYAPGETQKVFTVEARSRLSVTLRMFVSGSQTILETQAVLSVNRIPLSVVVNAPAAVLAGTVSAAFSVTLLDGLLDPIEALTATPVQLTSQLTSSGIFCSVQGACSGSPLSGNRLSVPSGANSASFYYLAGADSASSTQTLTVSSVGLSGASVSVVVFERVPTQLRISGGPLNGQVDLGLCQTVGYSVDLLDTNNLPVDPASSTQLTVSLAYTVGDGEFRSTCGSSTIKGLVFGSGETSKIFYITARAHSTVTIRASASNFSGTKSVSVNAVPYRLALTGSDTLTAGLVAGPYTLSVVDYLGAAVNASQAGVGAAISFSTTARMSFCSNSICSTRPGSLSVSIGAGTSTGAPFYLISDSDSSLSNLVLLADSMTALPDATLNFSVVRNSLSLDSSFASNGRLTFPVAGYSSGEIRASVFSGGKLAFAGYEVSGGSKRLMVGRANADRTVQNGALDTSFNSKGTNVISVGDESWASAIVPQGSGYLVAGVQQTNSSPSTSDIILLRVNSDGTVDTTFRFNAGVPDPVAMTGNQYATAIAIGGDGTIYVAGYSDPTTPSATNTSDLLLASFSSSGTLLASDLYDSGGVTELGQAILVQAFGAQDRILIGGTMGLDAGQDFMVARFMGNRGSSSTDFMNPDPSFGTSGFAHFDSGSAQADILRDMAFQASGRLVLVGSREAGISIVNLAGISGSTGALDSSFGSNGWAFTDVPGTSNEKGQAVAIDSRTNGIYVTGGAGSDILVARYSVNGTSDGVSPGYNRIAVSGGSAPTSYAISLGQESKPLVSGSAMGSASVVGLLR